MKKKDKPLSLSLVEVMMSCDLEERKKMMDELLRAVRAAKALCEKEPVDPAECWKIDRN